MILTKTPLRISFIGGGSDRPLVDVSPISTLDNRLNAFASGFVLAGKLAHAYTLLISQAHIANILLSKTRLIVRFAAPYFFRMQAGVVPISTGILFWMEACATTIAARLSSWAYFCGIAVFLMHVLCVVFWGSKKQVAWIAAGAIIAAMEHEQVVRNSAIGQFVGDAVRKQSQALIAHLSVAMTARAEFPRPAVFSASYLNTIPEALRGESSRCILWHVGNSLQLSAVPRAGSSRAVAF